MPRAPSEVHLKKRMSICQSVTPTTLQRELYDVTGATAIYSKPYGGGTMYMLIHDKPPMKHATLDKLITELDYMHRLLTSNSESIFKPVSNVLSGKIKTFERGEHGVSELYNAICTTRNPGGKKPKVQLGVEIWTLALDEQRDERDDLVRIFEDVDVQDQIMQEDPEAFGISTP